MPEIRKDVVRDRWVGLAVDQALKPNQFPSARQKMRVEGNDFCPFCVGHEECTPPEVFAIRDAGSSADDTGWSLRLIPNKFTTFHSDEEFIATVQGIYDSYKGFGRHEVLVEAPEHNLTMADYTLERMFNIINTWRMRYNQLAADRRFKYIQIYKNNGFLAGASIEHGHSQILAYPFVPDKHAGVLKYYKTEGRCLLCDMLEQEIRQKSRLLYNHGDFLLFMPYAPRFPYETWIVPHRHTLHFGDINDSEVEALSRLLRSFLRTVRSTLNNPAFNIMVHTAPINTEIGDFFHWFMEITPRMLISSGVEVASGIYMNPVAPEIAARMLREKIIF